jgi:hypothetical protein
MEYIFDIPNKKLSSDLFAKENNANLFIRNNSVVIIGFATKKEAEQALDLHNFIEKPDENIDKKKAILDRLGLTAEEAQLLLGGN